MLTNLYHFTLRLAAHRHAAWWLFFIAFIESSFFPIPPDILLIPLCLAARKRAFLLASICLLGSVLGGIAGYAIGYGLFDTIGRPLLAFYGHENALNALQLAYQEHGWWLVLMSATTPLPYKIFTIASGALHLDLIMFIVMSVIGRGIRFMLVAGLLYYFGEPIRAFIERRLGLLTMLAAILLIGGFLALGLKGMS